MDKPLISIIIPVYNIEAYIKECLDSILKQTYSNYEIIIVDDGSTDSSLNICNEYANKDKRIKVYQQENKGCGIARNTGLKYVKGSYITFIDGDDLIPENYLEILVSKSNGKDIAFVRYFFNWEKGITKKKTRIIPRSKLLKHYFKGKYLTSAWGKLIPKEYLDGIGFLYGYFEDIPTMYKIYFRADRLIECYETYYIYRKRDNSLTTTLNSEKYLPVFDNLEIIKKDLANYIKSKKEMVYYDYYRYRFYLIFYKFSINSTDQKVLEYRKAITSYLRKNTCKSLFRNFGWRLKYALILFSISPTMYFKVNNLRLSIKLHLFNRKEIILTKKGGKNSK